MCEATLNLCRRGWRPLSFPITPSGCLIMRRIKMALAAEEQHSTYVSFCLFADLLEEAQTLASTTCGHIWSPSWLISTPSIDKTCTVVTILPLRLIKKSFNEHVLACILNSCLPFYKDKLTQKPSCLSPVLIHACIDSTMTTLPDYSLHLCVHYFSMYTICNLLLR